MSQRSPPASMQTPIAGGEGGLLNCCPLPNILAPLSTLRASNPRFSRIFAARVCVCDCVCLSRSWILSKRVNICSNFFSPSGSQTISFSVPFCTIEANCWQTRSTARRARPLSDSRAICSFPSLVCRHAMYDASNQRYPIKGISMPCL